MYEDDSDDFETGIGSDGRSVKILRDGGRVRVPQYLRDSVPDGALTVDEVVIRMVERHKNNLVTDGTNNLWGLNRPGFRFAADPALRDAGRQRVADAHAAYVHDLTNAWRTPAANTGAQQFATPQAGNPCSKDGYAGTWQDDGDGNMVCVIDSRATGDSSSKSLAQLQLDHRAVMDQVYREHETTPSRC